MSSYTPRLKKILKRHGCRYDRPGKGDPPIKMAQEFSARSQITVVFVGVSGANVSRETFLVQEWENARRGRLFSRVRIAETSNGAKNFGGSQNNRCGSWVIRRERFTWNSQKVQENETRTVFRRGGVLFRKERWSFSGFREEGVELLIDALHRGQNSIQS
jgi:hypothetical protein